MSKLVLGVFLFLGLSSYSQNWKKDSVEMGANYSNDVFYNFTEEKISGISGNDEWDIAFFMGKSGSVGYSASVLANHAQPGNPDLFTGLQVYSIHKPASYWNFVNYADTLGLTQPLFNHEESYDKGAFNQNAGSSFFDFGWGFYNSSNHNLKGDSLFIIKKGSHYFKFCIDSMIGSNGNWAFRIANLNGSIQNTHYLVRSPTYDSVFYAYYDIETNSFQNREPIKSAWDIVFTQYTPLVNSQFGLVNFTSVGVLLKKGTKSSENTTSVPDSLTQMSVVNSTYINNYSQVGYDWKTYINSAFFVDSSKSFLIKSSVDTNTIYQLVFTNFEGNSLGKIKFKYRKFSFPSVIHKFVDANKNWNLYPNPAQNQLNLAISNPSNSKFEYLISNTMGQIVKSGVLEVCTGENNFPIDLYKLESGMYIVYLINGNTIENHSFIKEN